MSPYKKLGIFRTTKKKPTLPILFPPPSTSKPLTKIKPANKLHPCRKPKNKRANVEKHLEHALDEGVDLSAALSGVTALVEVEQLLPEAPVGVGKLERPEEVVGLLEVRPHRVNLVDQVLHTDDPSLPQGPLHDRVVGDRDPLLVHLPEPALVHELTHRLQVGVSVGHVRLHKAQHLHGSRVQLHEDGVVDLAEAQELEDLTDLGGDSDDTADTDHEHHLGLRRDLDVAGRLGLAAEADGVVLLRAVLLHVSFGALEDLLVLDDGRLREKIK